MKKLLTAGLVVALSMFCATAGVAQKGSARKGYLGHKKQEHVAKRTTEKGCPKCVALRKEIVALRKRLAATSKGKGKTKGHGRTSRRGRTEGRRGSRGERWGGRPDSKQGTSSEGRKERMDRMKKWMSMRKNWAI